MKTQIQTSNTGWMPREVAITLLTSRFSKTAAFRKRCLRATEKVCEPLNRSGNAPKTGEQRLQARLRKANAKQLHTWAKRTLARGNRLMDTRDEVSFTNDTDESKALVELLTKQIAAHDALIDAINIELTSRATRGIGYRKPVKFKKL